MTAGERKKEKRRRKKRAHFTWESILLPVKDQMGNGTCHMF